MSTGERRPAADAGEQAFELVSDFEPQGDQPGAIRELVAGIQRGDEH